MNSVGDYSFSLRTDVPQRKRMAPARVATPAPAQQQSLRLLSYNSQTGIAMSRFRHYLTHSWKHVLPYPERVQNLNSIAQLVSEFDVVGLQEVDAGSLRSGFINLTEYLGMQGRFPHWYDQTNRDLGAFAQHSIGVLSRFQPSEVCEHRLPGMIPGRGALIAKYGEGNHSLLVLVLHLALSRRARLQQLAYISDLVNDYPHVVVMGDLNCASDSPEMRWFLRHTDLCEPAEGLYTYPSWRPRRTIDHILVSNSLKVQNTRVLDHCYSDHLPITMEVVLPRGFRLVKQEPKKLPRDARIAAWA